MQDIVLYGISLQSQEGNMNIKSCWLAWQKQMALQAVQYRQSNSRAQWMYAAEKTFLPAGQRRMAGARIPLVWNKNIFITKKILTILKNKHIQTITKIYFSSASSTFFINNQSVPYYIFPKHPIFLIHWLNIYTHMNIWTTDHSATFFALSLHHITDQLVWLSMP